MATKEEMMAAFEAVFGVKSAARMYREWLKIKSSDRMEGGGEGEDGSEEKK